MPDIKQMPLSSFEFLRLLKNNNERNWFNDHKMAYQKELGYIESFAQQLLDLMNTHDVIETASGKKSLYRIYRDTRFSNDKTPYKTHWSGSFKRAGKQRRGGYYFHIEPGNSFVAGGFFGPSPQDLKLIREQISFDAAPLREILSVESFASFFGALKGEQLKTAPKGFDADHQDIDLLRYKQFLLIHQFTDEEVLSTDFPGYCNQGFKNMRPFFDYMSEILTTDANGMDL
ncbi:DUF2461 domain-containing protein [uncultured Pedobacter sp.]|uniref:DUF2461 domain-containing protein n=1 Tax=uncultured Pedobacter sp. TaxID=246139 RepID=UPI0025EAD7D2|nr:DUF2461 domain-containing protein [uncultured Pedobacter sp.]